MISGALAGAITQFIIYPLEIIKTRMALNKSHKRATMLLITNEIIRQHGPKGLYKGLSASLLGILPYTGIDLAIYSLLRDKYIYN
jgi:solute carrier family 25 phosphate transporter 23/24/25/41